MMPIDDFLNKNHQKPFYTYFIRYRKAQKNDLAMAKALTSLLTHMFIYADTTTPGVLAELPYKQVTFILNSFILGTSNIDDTYAKVDKIFAFSKVIPDDVIQG